MPLLRAAEDAAVEPWALLRAVRDQDGRVVDFVYRAVNPVAAQQQGCRPEELLGRRVTEAMPRVATSGLLTMYIHCVDTGEPLILDDFSYYARTLEDPAPDTHRYDVRAVRVETDYLSVTWRDVNRRYEAVRRVVESEEKFRLLAENSSDVVVHIRDLALAWVSPSVENSFGAPPPYWVGRPVESLVVAEDLPVFAEILERTDAGEAVVRRLRVRDVHGVVHWVVVHAKLFYDADGRPDGRTASLRVIDDEVAAEAAAEQARSLLAANADSMLDPQILFEPVRDAAGRITDFTYRHVNRAVGDYLDVRPEDLIGRSLVGTFPNLEESGLLARYVHCAETGEPVVVDDVAFYNGMLGASRRYDIRGARTQDGSISVVYRDVTERYELTRRVLDSEQHFRLLADNSTDVVAITGDDTTITWVAPSIGDCLGAPPAHWVGRPASSFVYPADLPKVAEILAEAGAGAVSIKRLRILDAHQKVHWAEFHSNRFHDADGHPRGFITSFRLVDDEVAAEHELEQARHKQAEADAIYRRSMESTAVATCLGMTDGTLIEVNDAFCTFFGYDPETMLTKTWLELTAPASLQTDLDKVADLVAGRIDSYRITKEYIHADGHPIWGDLFVGCLRRRSGDIQNVIGQIVDITAEVEGRRKLEQAYELLDASAESMLDPQVLLAAVRDPAGRVVDFRYASANRATCTYLNMTEADLLGASVLEFLPNVEGSGLLARFAQCVEDGQPVILTDFSYFNEIIDDARRYDIRASRAGADLLSLSWTDVTERYRAAQRIAASEEQYRLLAENAGDLVVHVRGTTVAWVSPSVADVLGGTPEHWIGRDVREVVPPEDLPAFAERLAILASGQALQQRVRVRSTDGVIHWVHLHSKPFYDSAGHMDGFTGAMRLIDSEVAAETAAAEARERQAHADARYRALIENSAIPTKLIAPDGEFLMVNQAMCDLIGYDAETLLHMGWEDITAPEDVARQRDLVADLVEGRQLSMRAEKRYVHADGHRIWADLSASSIRRPDGEVEAIIAQVVDITEAVTAREELIRREHDNRVLAQSLQSELDGAAHYLRSVLPGDMAGPVAVTTRYLPSNTVAGDCFDFLWIDDDHLIVYLLDVSGHGVKSALIAVSVHNLLRSGTLDTETLLAPDRVLATLNAQFDMDRHDGNFLTIFYGVYQPSTATLRYSNGGHPPALLLTDGRVTELPNESPPVGMFDDTTFPIAAVDVAPGSQLLVYSDGAYELPLDGGGYWTLEEFIEVCSRLAASPGWTLVQLVDTLRGHSATQSFDDDCTLVKVDFN